MPSGVTPPLQSAVNRFEKALTVPHKLLQLHPRTVGNPGNAAALSPAIVLGVTAAFETFAEEFVALMLGANGASYAEIAKKVGRWNNPDPREFKDYVERHFLSGRAILGPPVDIWVNTRIGHSSWSERPLPWQEALDDSAAWMQVRHLLTHGLVTGWKSEWWPAPLDGGKPHANTVLRDMTAGKHSLVLHGAISCARIYVHVARVVASEAAIAVSQVLDWSSLPAFE